MENQETIKEASAEEIIIGFRNGHLKNYLAAVARMRVAKSYPANEIIAQQQSNVPSGNNMPQTIAISAKKLAEMEARTADDQARYVNELEAMLEELKTNPTPWKQNK